MLERVRLRTDITINLGKHGQVLRRHLVVLTAHVQWVDPRQLVVIDYLGL